MYGEKSVELVREASRAFDNLQPFNEDLVRQSLEETKLLYEMNRKHVEENGDTMTPSMIYRHAAVERNKRCILAYINARMEKIRNMRWQFGAVLPADIKGNLCEPEQHFFTKYNRLLVNYMSSVGTDITEDLSPPRNLYVDVRVKQDYGELELPDGQVIQLKAGTQYHLPRNLCEQLIYQGVLEHVQS
eukprot:TRINITY_DN6297_c0_g2_i2.p1 TRINITY_DN6297_c0_g2~~TRINITY_DN6297_c0_g2_i2.p1  ORF type:complete len:198 (+),score=21.01 TRINITY_DN6297_c0_g2_i2:32-595(+)